METERVGRAQRAETGGGRMPFADRTGTDWNFGKDGGILASRKKIGTREGVEGRIWRRQFALLLAARCWMRMVLDGEGRGALGSGWAHRSDGQPTCDSRVVKIAKCGRFLKQMIEGGQ